MKRPDIEKFIETVGCDNFPMHPSNAISILCEYALWLEEQIAVPKLKELSEEDRAKIIAEIKKQTPTSMDGFVSRINREDGKVCPKCKAIIDKSDIKCSVCHINEVAKILKPEG